MRIVEIEQNTAEWHRFRKDKIGASLAPVIMGVSPWMTPYQLYEQMLGITEPTEENEAMRRGKYMEEDARALFVKQTNIFVKPAVGVHEKFNWLMASFDGLCLDNKVIVEIKCPGQSDHHAALDGKVPEKYFPQLQHQIAVSGYDRAYYFSYDGKTTALLTVRRDEEYIVELVKKERDFYNGLLTFTPPKLTDRDYVLCETTEWRDLVAEYKTLQDEMQVREDRINVIRANLQVLAQGKNTKGCGIAVQKIARKGAIDYSAIPQLKDVDVEKYRKAPSEFWQIRSLSS